MENNAANNDCAVTGKIAGVRTLKYAKTVMCYKIVLSIMDCFIWLLF